MIDINQHISISSHDDISTICKPLFQNFPIKVFEYSRVYPNGARCELCSNPLHLENAFLTKKTMVGTHTPVLIPKEAKWLVVENWINSLPESQNKMLIEQLKSQREILQIGNEFSIIKRYDDFVEYYHFYCNYNDFNSTNILLNNIDLLEHFIIYFKEKAHPIILKSIKQPLIKAWKNVEYENDIKKNNNFLESTKIDSLRFFQNEMLEKLTRTELFYAKQIIKGLSAPEIAERSFRSKKTVESCIYKLKKKLECNKKSQLHDKLLELNIDKIL